MEATENQPRILAVVQDLFFRAKIMAAANRVGFPLEFVADGNQTFGAEPAPNLILVDLNDASLDPIDLIRRLKADPARKAIPVVGYLSHVQQELQREARKAGCDVVLPRSVFSQNLDELLRKHSCYL